MKKVLLISNIANKFTNFIIPSIKVLEQMGYEVHTCANYTGFMDDKTKYNIKMHQIDFIRNPFNPKNIKAYKQLLKLMKEEQFDAVHCNTPIGGLLGRICAKKTKVPIVIYTAHGFHFYKGAPPVNMILYKSIERWLAHYTDVLITINKEDYDAAKKFKLKKNGMVKFTHGIGIDTKSFRLQNFDRKKYRNKLEVQDDDIMLISAGDLIKRKNYDIAIKAISQINDSKLHYFICGTGKLEKKLKKLVIKYKLENQIHFLGFRNDIVELMNSSDVFLFTTSQEGLPRSMMEAMASGLPCIVSKIRGNTDLIDEKLTYCMCNPKSYIEFSDAIRNIINNKKLQEQMKEINLIKIKQYDTNVFTKEIEKIYKEILNNECS